MTHSLAGAFEKVTRAEQHIQKLDTEIQEFLASKPYSIRFYPYRQYSEQFGEPLKPTIVDQLASEADRELLSRTTVTLYEQLIKGTRLRVVIERNHPAVEWGVTIGEIVHDLRSALDHLAFSLTARDHGPVPDPFPLPGDKVYGKWREVAFPIFLKEDGWNAAITKAGNNKGPIWGIQRPRELAHLKRLQPFHGSRKRPELDWLWLLGELWNSDKHRQIQLVSATLGVRPFRLDFSRWDATDRPPPRWRTRFKRAPGPFQDGAELARVEFFDRINIGELDAYVQVNLPITYEIHFADGRPAYGGGSSRRFSASRTTRRPFSSSSSPASASRSQFGSSDESSILLPYVEKRMRRWIAKRGLSWLVARLSASLGKASGACNDAGAALGRGRCILVV